MSQGELDGAVVDGGDAGDVGGLDVVADRLDLGRHLGEPLAELDQAGDRVEVVGAGGGALNRVAHPLDAAHDVLGDDGTRLVDVPHDVVA